MGRITGLRTLSATLAFVLYLLHLRLSLKSEVPTGPTASFAAALHQIHFFVITNNDGSEPLYKELTTVGVNPQQITVVPPVSGKQCRHIYRAPQTDLGTDRCKGCDCDANFCAFGAADTMECPGGLHINVTAPFLNRPAASGELGCTASHLTAIRAVYDSGVKWGLVLEGDASIALVPWWGPIGINAVVADLPADWGVLQCHVHFGKPAASITRMVNEWQAGKTARRRTHIGTDRNLWSTVAYAVSRQGAANLLARYWTTTTATMDIRLNPLADVLVYSGPSTFVVNRPFFEHKLSLNHTTKTTASMIHSSHSANHRINQHLVLDHFYTDGVRAPFPWLGINVALLKMLLWVC